MWVLHVALASTATYVVASYYYDTVIYLWLAINMEQVTILEYAAISSYNLAMIIII